MGSRVPFHNEEGEGQGLAALRASTSGNAMGDTEHGYHRMGECF